jgi:hypothetical protein
MKHFSRVLIAFCLFGFGTTIQAQESITVSGGNGTGTGGTISYTAGQIVYTYISGTGGNISQGVQQIEISILSGTDESAGIILDISAYPNPATGFVKLKVESYDMENLSYKLFDMNGILFQSKRIEGSETQIQLGNILPGTYLLKIDDNNKVIKTFKIIKK